MSAELIERYYAAFNDGTAKACSPAQRGRGARREPGQAASGKEAFREFTRHMERCYGEQLENMTIMAATDGTRAAAEFSGGRDLYRDRRGAAAGAGQTYTLPAGTFFEVRDGLIARVTTYYNLADWLAQVGAQAA